MCLRSSLTIRRRHALYLSLVEVQGAVMVEFNRRKIVGMSAGGLTALCLPSRVLAAAQCVTGPLPGFLPNSLTVDCASRRNFQTFRQNSAYLGLAGVVSMSAVRTKQGSFQAGNLFL